jgi:uncharacterized membrane protein YkvA (DUF1232 family)
MDFHWWMLLPLIPLTMVALVVFRIVRVRRRGRQFLRLSRSERLEFARIVVRDGELPLVPRLLVGAAAGYLALPVDLIPDFIPVIGHADDFLVVTLLIAVITRTVPPERLDALAREARGERPSRSGLTVN